MASNGMMRRQEAPSGRFVAPDPRRLGGGGKRTPGVTIGSHQKKPTAKGFVRFLEGTFSFSFLRWGVGGYKGKPIGKPLCLVVS